MYYKSISSLIGRSAMTFEKFISFWIETAVYCFILSVFLPKVADGTLSSGHTVLMALGVKMLVDRAIEHFDRNQSKTGDC